MWKSIIAFVPRVVQARVSFIGFNKNAVLTLGKPDAKYKVAEVSVAVLTFGIRITVRV